ncbi:nucleolar protein,Nop52-domain-containing protein [Paraphysoderma sedebokerense]|nr:nucleolar protein,Nop52-domain-containing protein [Paraphysoderma sedebokerense]
MTQEQTTVLHSRIGQKLAATEKKTRDKAFKSLKRWLTSQTEISDLDLRKLWKALFYCYWLSDKVPIQQELADNLASLCLILPDMNGIRYVNAFWDTMMAEWYGIDRLRLDKFYSLFRKIHFYTFRLLEKNCWDSDFIDCYLEMMINGPLRPNDDKVPHSITYHIIEVFLEEMESALDDSIPAEIFTQLITLFVTLMAESENQLIVQKIKTELFDKMSDMVADILGKIGGCHDDNCSGCENDKENEDVTKVDPNATADINVPEEDLNLEVNDDTASDSDASSDSFEDPDTVFDGAKLQISLPDIVSILFEVGADPSIPDKNRKKIYDLVRELRNRFDIVFEMESGDEDEGLYDENEDESIDGDDLDAFDAFDGEEVEPGSDSEDGMWEDVDDNTPAEIGTGADHKKRKANDEDEIPILIPESQVNQPEQPADSPARKKARVSAQTENMTMSENTEVQLSTQSEVSEINTPQKKKSVKFELEKNTVKRKDLISSTCWYSLRWSHAYRSFF